jgi:hypothetical protein
MVLNLKRFQKYIYIKSLGQGNLCSEKTLCRKKKKKIFNYARNDMITKCITLSTHLKSNSFALGECN